MMKDYFQKSMRALQLAGMSESTQDAYTRSVRQLVDFYGKTPDKIDEKELEDYFMHRQHEDKWSPATLRIAYSGIKFFFVNILKQDLHLFKYLNAKRESRLPCILSRPCVVPIHRVESSIARAVMVRWEATTASSRPLSPTRLMLWGAPA